MHMKEEPFRSIQQMVENILLEVCKYGLALRQYVISLNTDEHVCTKTCYVLPTK